MRDFGVRCLAAGLAVLLLLSGCGSKAGKSGAQTKEQQVQGQSKAQGQTEQQERKRTVSGEFEGFGTTGLTEEQLKESGTVFTDGPVAFQDPVTEEMLRNMLGKPDGEVLRSELQQIHAIYWRYDKYWSDLQKLDGTIPQESDGGYWQTKQPASLEDFALCGNLQWVEFGAVELPSLEPLSGLPQLEMIAFHGASASEERVDELAALSALRGFIIGNGAGTDWSGITDGSFLLPMADRLVHLEAGGKIDWNPKVLAQLTNLERLLMWAPRDLSFLPELKKLRKLCLSVEDEIDGSPIGEAVWLEWLTIVTSRGNTTGITLDDLRPLTGLRYLGLIESELNDRYTREEIIEAFPSLEILYTT